MSLYFVREQESYDNCVDAQAWLSLPYFCDKYQNLINWLIYKINTMYIAIILYIFFLNMPPTLKK